jgi:hypothetical protein
MIIPENSISSNRTKKLRETERNWSADPANPFRSEKTWPSGEKTSL